MTKQKIKQETQNKTDTQIDENISIIFLFSLKFTL